MHGTGHTQVSRKFKWNVSLILCRLSPGMNTAQSNYHKSLLKQQLDTLEIDLVLNLSLST